MYYFIFEKLKDFHFWNVLTWLDLFHIGQNFFFLTEWLLCYITKKSIYVSCWYIKCGWDMVRDRFRDPYISTRLCLYQGQDIVWFTCFWYQLRLIVLFWRIFFGDLYEVLCFLLKWKITQRCRVVYWIWFLQYGYNFRNTT